MGKKTLMKPKIVLRFADKVVASNTLDHRLQIPRPDDADHQSISCNQGLVTNGT